MSKQITDFLSESDLDFLRTIEFIPPPVKLSHTNSGLSLFDEMLGICFPGIFPVDHDILETGFSLSDLEPFQPEPFVEESLEVHDHD